MCQQVHVDRLLMRQICADPKWGGSPDGVDRPGRARRDGVERLPAECGMGEEGAGTARPGRGAGVPRPGAAPTGSGGRSADVTAGSAHVTAAGNHHFDEYNYAASHGLLWLLSFLPGHPRTVCAVGIVLGLSGGSSRRRGTVPCRCTCRAGRAKPANACAYVLCDMREEAALAELTRLTTLVTYKSTLAILEAGLKARAEALASAVTRSRSQPAARSRHQPHRVPGMNRPSGQSPQNSWWLNSRACRRALHWGQ